MEKYTDMKSDNLWLHRIANECAETNQLLQILIASYNQNNSKKNDNNSKSVPKNNSAM